MKVLALLAVMANIVFFLWEYHSGALLPEKGLQVSDSKQLQTILLASEVRQSHEDQALWQAEAVKERSPYVSDYIRAQLAGAKMGAGKALFLPEGPITVPWSQLLAEVRVKREELPESSRLSKTESLIADAGGVQATVDAQAKAKVSEEPPESGNVPAAGRTKPQAAVNVIPDQALGTAPPGEPVGALKSEETALCYEAGPFESMDLFKQWRRRTGIAAKFITPVQHEEQEVTGYLVFYPAPETFEQAVANVEMLKKKGITDLWLFRKGESKGEISLGLFRNKTRAEVLEKQLLEKDIEVMIKPRYKSTNRLYALVSTTQESEDKLAASRDLWQKRHPEFAIKAGSDCAMKPDESQD